MELDEKSQYFLMLFIKKAMGEGKENVFEDTELNKKEIEILRNEKARLTQQLVEIQLEFNKTRDAKEKLCKENESLHLSIIDLQSEITQSPNKFERTNTEINHLLEKKLIEKTRLLENSQGDLREKQEKYETEISQLRDELDIAHTKNYQMSQMEKSLENYKKKLEKMTGMKKRLIDLKRNNDHMQQLIIEHQCEIETYQQYKKSSVFYKEELGKEKEKNNGLLVALEMKEKQVMKLNKVILEMSDKILYQENRISELEQPFDASFVSEDSFNYGKIDNEPDFKKNNRLGPGPMQVGPPSESAAKEINSLKMQLKEKKEILTSCKETVKMQNEEIISKNYYAAVLISQLSSRNNAMSDKLQGLSEEISVCEHEKESNRQMIHEISSLKAYKDSLLSEIKSLYEEKDLIYKKYIAGREEVIALQGTLHDKEFANKDLHLELQLLTERLKNSETTQKDSKTPEKSVKLEDSIKALVLENCELSQRIKQKDEKIESMIEEKAKNLKLIESEYKENLARVKQEYDWKISQNFRQTEDALSQIQKEKDELQARLNIEKKSTLLEWKRAMILKDPSLMFTEDHGKMNLQIAELEKENEKLLRTNQELTICWKDSAKMLKSVSKSVGIETKRMQDIMKQKH